MCAPAGARRVTVRFHDRAKPKAHPAIFVVRRDEYVYLVPFVEDERMIFLKTVIPSRKATKQYLGGEPDDHEA